MEKLESLNELIIEGQFPSFKQLYYPENRYMNDKIDLNEFHVFGKMNPEFPDILYNQSKNKLENPISNFWGVITEPIDATVEIAVTFLNDNDERYYIARLVFKESDTLYAIKRFVPDELIIKKIVDVVAVHVSSKWTKGEITIFCSKKEEKIIMDERILDEREIVLVYFFRSPIQNGLYEIVESSDSKLILKGLHESADICVHVSPSEVAVIKGNKFKQFRDKEKYSMLLVKLNYPEPPYSMQDWEIVCTKRYGIDDI
jgi:hypothetical protein